MVEFKVVVNDPRDGRSYSLTVSGSHANYIVRKRIGDEIDGMYLGLPGYKLVITGGSDRSGIPMRAEIATSGRRRILVSDSLGFHPRSYRGQRRRRLLRGNEISPEIVQINAKITQFGPRPIPDLVQAKAG